jgi:hypothetical protein
MNAPITIPPPAGPDEGMLTESGILRVILAELNYEVSQNSSFKCKRRGDRCNKVLTGFFQLADLVRAKPQKFVGGITVPSSVDFAMILRMSEVCVVSVRNKSATRL